MPNEALIAELDRLREAYSQRQRSVNSLMKALKATAVALSKASRALREYGEQNGNVSAELSRAQEVFGGVRLKEEAIDPLQPDLRRELKQLTVLSGALKDALAALRGEAVDVVRLGHVLKVLQESKIPDAALAELLPQLDQELELGQRTLGDTFGLALRHALAEQGLELGGRPPRFELGPFELTADFVNRRAVLSYGKTPVNTRVPLSVEGVIQIYQREARAIMGRNEDGTRWIEGLYNAWETVRRKRGSGEGRANIVECFYEFVLLRQARAFRYGPSKSAFVDYSRAQFAYDFFQFTDRRPVHYKGLRAVGHVATKSHLETVERSIWIVEGRGPHDGRFIADINFEQVG